MRKFFLAALLALASGQVLAQQYEYGTPVPVRGGDDRPTRFGLFIAPNISWMKPTSNKSNDKLYLIDAGGSKVGFSWGLMIDYFFAENYGIATGFSITSTGGKINTQFNPNLANPPADTNLVTSTTFDYKLRFLEVPFALKLRSDELEPGGTRLFGQLGLTAAACIGKKASYDVTYYDAVGVSRTVQGENEKLTGTSISPVMLQLNLGGGIEYPITQKLSFYAGIFFNNGFVPDATFPKQFDLDYTGKFDDGNVRLNNVCIRLGLFF